VLEVSISRGHDHHSPFATNLGRGTAWRPRGDDTSS
jgi:hypothetical protein